MSFASLTLCSETLQDRQTVLAYLLQEGTLTDGEWNYQGGRWWPGSHYASKMTPNQLLDHIRAVGVDWSKTDFPVYESKSEFTDTNSASASVDTLLGTIVLLNQAKVLFGAIDVDDVILNIIEDAMVQAKRLDYQKKAAQFWAA